MHCVAIKGTFDDCQDIVKESGRVREDVSIKPLRGPMVFIVFNLGILGDNLPINTHYIGLI